MREWRKSLEPLRERPFRMLFLGRTLSSVGDAIVPLALTFAVIEIGDATDLGIVLGGQAVARVVCLVAGGVWADRLPRQLVMMAADVVRAVVQILLAFAFLSDSIRIWQLAAGAAIFGAASAFFNPASTGLVPEVVSAARLQEANALLGLARSATAIFGPVSAGLIVSTVGFGAVFAVDAVSFVASFVCLAAMRLSRVLARREPTSMIADALAGLQVVRGQRWMVAGLSCDAAFNLALSAYFVLGPIVFKEHFGGASDWAWMLTAFSVGAVVGGFFVLRYKPARPLLAAYTFAFVTPLLLIALARPVPLALLVVGGTLFGLEVVLANTFWETMEQQHIPAEFLSRASSLSWMTSLVVTPLGLAIVGPLSAAVGVETTLVSAAALASVALIGALAVPEFRNLRRLDEQPQAISP